VLGRRYAAPVLSTLNAIERPVKNKISILVLFLIGGILMVACQKNLKEVEYRGGIVNFSIPSTWVEEYETDGGGTFYEDRPDSGTLRLNVLTFKTPVGEVKVKAIDALPSLKSASGNPELLSESVAYIHYVKRSEEDGEDITIYWWVLSQVLESNYVRILNFSYTILTSQEDELQTQAEVELLTEQIRKARLHPEVGQ